MKQKIKNSFFPNQSLPGRGWTNHDYADIRFGYQNTDYQNTDTICSVQITLL